MKKLVVVKKDGTEVTFEEHDFSVDIKTESRNLWIYRDKATLYGSEKQPIGFFANGEYSHMVITYD